MPNDGRAAMFEEWLADRDRDPGTGVSVVRARAWHLAAPISKIARLRSDVKRRANARCALHQASNRCFFVRRPSWRPRIDLKFRAYRGRVRRSASMKN